MPKWEYINLRTADGKILLVNGQKAADSKFTLLGEVKGTNVYDYLSRLGQDGWEIAGVTSDVPGVLIYVLKRPIT